MNHKRSKLESPERLAELRPMDTLKKIGLGENDVVCDIGAGSGIFTIPAAKITNNQVFALDINDEFLGIINEKAREERLTNIMTMKAAGEHYDIEANTVDFVILVTVLHEIENKDILLAELKRIMKSTGRAAVIEFHKRETPMGPPVAHRIGREEVVEAFDRYGFSKSDEFQLGDNLYCVTFSAWFPQKI